MWTRVPSVCVSQCACLVVFMYEKISCVVWTHIVSFVCDVTWTCSICWTISNLWNMKPQELGSIYWYWIPSQLFPAKLYIVLIRYFPLLSRVLSDSTSLTLPVHPSVCSSVCPWTYRSVCWWFIVLSFLELIWKCESHSSVSFDDSFLLLCFFLFFSFFFCLLMILFFFFNGNET